MKVYLASSFAYKDKTVSEERKAKIVEAKEILKSKGLDVYVPYEHQIPNAWDYPNNEWALMVFTNDMMAIKDCDVVVLLSYGKEKNNAGVSWECGFAYGSGKKVVIVRMSDEVESLMMWHGSYAQVQGLRGMSGLNSYDFNKMPIHRIEAVEQS